MWLLTVNQHLPAPHFIAASHMRTSSSASGYQHPCLQNGVLRKMQRRHSSNTDNGPPERNRSQALSSEASVDEGGVFESLKAESASPPALFSGLPGLPAGSLPTTPFPSSLVLGASAGGGDVFIQMPASREEAGGRGEGGAYHHRQPHHHFHHSGHRGSSLLQHVGGDHRAHSDEGSDEQPGTPAPALSELKAVVCWLQKGLPFILILLAKVCFQHKLGIAVCIGMASTFAYANSTLREQVSLKEKRSVLVILWILAFLAGNTLYVLYTFSSQQLYNSLIFLKPNLETLDFFDLLWIVGIADFVLKYVTIALKCLVVALPKIILAVKSKGKFYLVIEELSQLFRSLVPIQLWYKYIMGDDSSNSYFLGGVLIVLYSLCKSFDICGRVGGVRKALKLLCSSQNYGVRATGQQCTEAGDICAICQAEFRDPLILMCQMRKLRHRAPCGHFPRVTQLTGVDSLSGFRLSATMLTCRSDTVGMGPSRCGFLEAREVILVPMHGPGA
ncbi:RING finger and transmembrane domain-containing protein 2 isoform X1 [Lutra lutra]|uniref:RING finger and transmembrane domain-containing protein 2 isoform X1 n=1 Tax=Lutra lutra TaxID=9657 RepID=UPI001FD1F327|nr:RING finger and transmembrane domain-containing protein 2 isoform X1 [Lutra lutra]